MKLGEPLQVQDRCIVKWRGDHDQTLEAVVIERRPRGHRKRKMKESMPDVASLPADEIEYYVHYEGHDRRLDSWLTLDKFDLETLQRFQDTTELGAVPECASMIRRRSSAILDAHSEEDPSGGPDNNNNNSSGAPRGFLTGGNWHRSGDPSMAALEKEHEETTKIKNIEKIVMDGWEVEAWYFSPFPEPYVDLDTLYVCHWCLTYMRKARSYRKHISECQRRHPPGKEIYREGDLSAYEIDGDKEHSYCQKLCLLAKLFLDHKTLYFHPKPFLFYVITKVNSQGAHIVGYFSKEKESTEGYNLACILTFPQYQKSGYGKFIISLSYELSKREGKTGSPEKPLSDLGKVSYRSYWTYVIMSLLAKHDSSKDITINSISKKTGIKTEDLISTLQSLEMIKVWKGQHVVYVNQDTIREYMKQRKPLRLCNPECLNWEPPSTKGVSYATKGGSPNQS